MRHWSIFSSPDRTSSTFSSQRARRTDPVSSARVILTTRPIDPSDRENSLISDMEIIRPAKETFPMSGLMLPILVRISLLPRSRATSMAAVRPSHRPAMRATFSSTLSWNSCSEI